MIYKVNQDTYARLFKELLENPISAHDAVETTGIHLTTAQNLLRCLKKHKVVHITAWDPDSLGRDVTPVYALGAGRDKPRRKKSAAERQRQCRQRKANAKLVSLNAVHV